MSATLCWTPIINLEGKALSDQLKYILGRKLCDTDGTIGYDTVVDEGLIPYLEGLRDSDIEDADKLIKAIKKHGSVNLSWIH